MKKQFNQISLNKSTIVSLKGGEQKTPPQQPKAETTCACSSAPSQCVKNCTWF